MDQGANKVNTTSADTDELVFVPLRGFVKASELNKKPRTQKQLAADRRRHIDALIRKANKLVGK
jgi:cytochrome oxidase assembly protein ShyY1